MAKGTDGFRKLIALACLLTATCWGTSCSTDLRDAVWSGVLDYATGTTTSAMSCVLNLEECPEFLE